MVEQVSALAKADGTPCWGCRLILLSHSGSLARHLQAVVNLLPFCRIYSSDSQGEPSRDGNLGCPCFQNDRGCHIARPQRGPARSGLASHQLTSSACRSHRHWLSGRLLTGRSLTDEVGEAAEVIIHRTIILPKILELLDSCSAAQLSSPDLLCTRTYGS
jgi:hypothetical protein